MDLWKPCKRWITGLRSSIYPTISNFTQFIIYGNFCACFECYLHPSSLRSNSSTIAAGSSNGVTNTRCCRYSCMRSWWWVQVTLETCTAVSIYNKLRKVASCWTYIGIYLRCTDPWTSNWIVVILWKCHVDHTTNLASTLLIKSH